MKHTADRTKLSSPVMVGRDDDVATLAQALSRGPSLAIVEGDAGMGKTRLVRTVMAHPLLRTRRALYGQAHGVRESFPLGPVIEALRGSSRSAALTRLSAAAGSLRSLLPELADVLPAAPDALDDPRAGRHRQFRGIGEILAAQGPCVLVLEDLHWADEGTCDLLTFLSRNLPDSLSLIATYRSEDLAGRPFQRVTATLSAVADAFVSLRPLDGAQVRDMVAATLDTTVSETFADFLRAHTSGVPFAVEETLRLLHDRDDLQLRSGQWIRRAIDDLRVPTAIRDRVAERVSRLSPEAVRIVQAAAVCCAGGATDEAGVSGVAGLTLEQTVAAMAEAAAAALLDDAPDGRITFRHELTRQAVHESLTGPQRRLLHRRAFAALAQQPSPAAALLAHHARQAGDTEAFVRYSELAADEATRLGDDAKAAEFLLEAVSAAALDGRGRLAIKLGHAALHSMRHSEAIDALRAAAADPALERRDRGRIRLSLGWLLFQDADAAGAFVQIERAVPDLEDLPGEQARAMSTLAMPWVQAGTASQHRRWLDRAMAAASRQDDPLVTMAVAVDRAYLLLSLGDREGWAALDELPAPATMAEQRQASRALLNAAQAAVSLGYYERARELVQRGLVLGEALDYARHRNALQATGLLVDWAVGAWSEITDRATAVIEASPAVSEAVDALVPLGAVTAARGDVDQGCELLRRAVAIAQEAGNFPLLAAAAGALAAVAPASAAGDAACIAISTFDLLAAKELWAACADVAPAAVSAYLQRDRARAEQAVRRLALAARTADAPTLSAAVVECRGLLLEHDGALMDAATAFRDASDRWHSLPRPMSAARALERAAACLFRTSDAQAVQLARAAHDSFAACGAPRDADRVQRLLRRNGVSVGRRGPRGYGTQLSPRELEVARLAAMGKTDREIADDLYLSPRTVGRHLSNSFRKLGVSSRNALPADLGVPEKIG